MVIRVILYLVIIAILLRVTRSAYYEFLKALEDKKGDRQKIGGETNQSQTNSNRKTEKEYGQILGLKGQIGKGDIKKAYREKVRQYHPDTVQNMAVEFQELAKKKTGELNEAYDFFKKKYNF